MPLALPIPKVTLVALVFVNLVSPKPEIILFPIQSVPLLVNVLKLEGGVPRSMLLLSVNSAPVFTVKLNKPLVVKAPPLWVKFLFGPAVKKIFATPDEDGVPVLVTVPPVWLKFPPMLKVSEPEECPAFLKSSKVFAPLIFKSPIKLMVDKLVDVWLEITTLELLFMLKFPPILSVSVPFVKTKSLAVGFPVLETVRLPVTLARVPFKNMLFTCPALFQVKLPKVLFNPAVGAADVMLSNKQVEVTFHVAVGIVPAF